MKKKVVLISLFVTIFMVAIIFVFNIVSKGHGMHITVDEPIQLDVKEKDNLKVASRDNLKDDTCLKTKDMGKSKSDMGKEDADIQPPKKREHSDVDSLKKRESSVYDKGNGTKKTDPSKAGTVDGDKKEKTNDSVEGMDKAQATKVSAQTVQSIYNSVVPPYLIPSSEELNDKKIVYLTFDDGPSANVTPQVLDILKEEGVKATFFVIGSLAEQNRDLVKREANEGHVVANHSYSHDYKALYSNIDMFIDEIERTDNILSDIIGDEYTPKYMRMPGGGFGAQYEPFKATLLKKGYNYITWNAVTNDAVEKNPTPEKLFANFKETLNGNKFSVVLMHDGAGQKATPQSLRLVIKYLKQEGYEFRTFDR